MKELLIGKYKINPNMLYPKILNFFFLIRQSTIEICFHLLKKCNFSYYDGLTVASALENKCSKLYLEDMQNNLLIKRNLKIINPFKEINR